MRAVDLAPGVEQPIDRVTLPVKQCVQRLVGPRSRVVESVAGLATASPTPGTIWMQPQHPARPSRRPSAGNGLVDQLEQAGLDLGVHPRWDRAGTQPQLSFSPEQVQLDRLLGDRRPQPFDLGPGILERELLGRLAGPTRPRRRQALSADCFAVLTMWTTDERSTPTCPRSHAGCPGRSRPQATPDTSPPASDADGDASHDLAVLPCCPPPVVLTDPPGGREFLIPSAVTNPDTEQPLLPR
jgi:hypothetical protein